MLFPEQHDDVLKAEQRYAKPDGHGMLFTNGTGTGKTYSGLGVIKRMAMQGNTNTLVVAPSQGILMDWVKSARDLGLDINVLGDTQDKGKGLTAITDKAGLSVTTRKFLGLLAANRRTAALGVIIRSFHALAAARRGAVSAHVVTAIPLTDAQSAALASALRTALGKDPEIETRVDPAILGGVKVRVGSRLYDASLKSKLDSLKFALKRA